MTINVCALFEVRPMYEMRKPSSLDLTVSMDEYRLEKLFYQIWEDVGDDGLNKWLTREGYNNLHKDKDVQESDTSKA